MPARLVEVILINSSPFPIHWVDDFCEWGDWQDPWWPSKIKDLKTGQRAAFRQESQDWFSGCEGWAYFKVDITAANLATTEYLKLSWARPFFGAFGGGLEHFKTDSTRQDNVRLLNRGVRPLDGGEMLPEMVADLTAPVGMMSFVSQIFDNHVAWFVEVAGMGNDILSGRSTSALSGDQQFETVTHVTASVERVWEALIRPERTVKYWRDVRVESPWSVGSRVSVIPTHGGRAVESGTVLESVPNRRLSFTLKAERCEDCVDSRVTFALEPVGATTRLTLVHDRLPKMRHVMQLHDGWRSILAGLNNELEGRADETGPRDLKDRRRPK